MFSFNKCFAILSLASGLVTPAIAADFWLVKVAFDANGSEIQQVQQVSIPDGHRRTTQLPQAGAFTVSGTDAQGKVLQQVSLDDPRIIRVPMLPGQIQGHQFVVRDEGDFTLVLPAQPDASQLQLKWPELPGLDAPADSSQQQLSLQQFSAQLQLQ
jgi:hypothetical protein